MSKDADTALVKLIELLRECDYQFVTPTPASHARVVARPERQQGRDVRDLLGWSLPVPPQKIDPRIADLLRLAGALDEPVDGLLKSRVRISGLHGQLFIHSAYPTEAEDAVFFGPDSYRFADLIAAELQHRALPTGAHIVDMGAGAGVGGIVAGLLSASARVTLTDLNPKALRLARINARAAGIAVDTLESETLDEVGDPIDLAVINPPYIIDDSNRAYRDGGGMKGGEVPVQMAQMAADRIAPGGRVILYTGAAITDGHNALADRLAAYARNKGFSFTCRELDPDVFGEELEGSAYEDVERIALVGIGLVRPD